MEGHDIRFKRIQYLKQLKQFKAEERPIFFTDENYIHTSHLPKYSWNDGSSKGIRVPVSKTKSGDYHAVAARQDQNRVGTSNFFGQFFRVIFF
jgi:hypothetical protein